MDTHKNGLLSMSMWFLFLILLFGSYMYITDSPFGSLADEETGGFISAFFFLAWALIWFGIGRHYSMVYAAQKQVFIKKHPGIERSIVAKAFKRACFSKVAQVLSKVFFVAVPFYVAANVRDMPSLKDCVFIGVLMIVSIVLYAYYKRNKTSATLLL